MDYDKNATNETLHSKTYYALYIGPKDSGTSHLLFKLSMKQLLNTPKYKPVPMPEDIIQAVYEMGTYTNKIDLNHFDRDQYTVHQNHFGNTPDDNQEHYVTMEHSDHESDGHLDDSQQQRAGANYDTRFLHRSEILQPVESCISTIVSMKCASADISTSVFLKYVSTGVSTERVSMIKVCRRLYYVVNWSF